MMRFVRHIGTDTRGAILVETAIAAPLLALLMLGAFDVSRMVTRQLELQEVAAEISAASMARAPDDTGMLMLQRAAAASGGLDEDQVVLTRKVKCGLEPTLYDSGHECAEGVEESVMITIDLSDTYEPGWTSFGVGGPVPLHVLRSVQVG